MQLIPYLLTQVTIMFLPFGSAIPQFPGHFCTGGETAINGYYNSDIKQVVICEDKNQGQKGRTTQLTINHELGHHVHFKLATPKEWEQYQIEWKKSVDMGADLFNRPYGTTNAMEGFADDFMYLNDDGYQSYLPAKKRFQREKRVRIVRKIIQRLTVEAKKH